jgi:hypothetical protein
LITRDVFIAYITDTALQLPHTQKLIVMLEHLEQALVSRDTTDKYTDKVMDVYRQLANTLTSEPKGRRKQAERLWKMFTEAAPEYSKRASPASYTGFSGAVEITQRFNAMSPRERETLVSAINTALERYDHRR